MPKINWFQLIKCDWLLLSVLYHYKLHISEFWTARWRLKNSSWTLWKFWWLFFSCQFMRSTIAGISFLNLSVSPYFLSTSTENYMTKGKKDIFQKVFNCVRDMFIQLSAVLWGLCLWRCYFSILLYCKGFMLLVKCCSSTLYFIFHYQSPYRWFQLESNSRIDCLAHWHFSRKTRAHTAFKIKCLSTANEQLRKQMAVWLANGCYSL